MSVIKLHLEDEEFAPVCRFAEQLQVKPEDIVYAALNRIMLSRADAEVCAEIPDARIWRKDNLPLWADSARSVHAYEGKTDDHPAPRL